MRSEVIFIGIDPGRSGGFAWSSPNGDWAGVEAWSTPAEIKERLRWLHTGGVCCAALEKVSAMRGWGTASVFAFGENYGTWTGLLTGIGIPFVRVRPAVWMKALGLVTKKRDKLAAKRLAEELHPELAPIQRELADAVCIASWLEHERNGGRYD